MCKIFLQKCMYKIFRECFNEQMNETNFFSYTSKNIKMHKYSQFSNKTDFNPQ